MLFRPSRDRAVGIACGAEFIPVAAFGHPTCRAYSVLPYLWKQNDDIRLNALRRSTQQDGLTLLADETVPKSTPEVVEQVFSQCENVAHDFWIWTMVGMHRHPVTSCRNYRDVRVTTRNAGVVVHRAKQSDIQLVRSAVHRIAEGPAKFGTKRLPALPKLRTELRCMDVDEIVQIQSHVILRKEALRAACVRIDSSAGSRPTCLAREPDQRPPGGRHG